MFEFMYFIKTVGQHENDFRIGLVSQESAIIKGEIFRVCYFLGHLIAHWRASLKPGMFDVVFDN